MEAASSHLGASQWYTDGSAVRNKELGSGAFCKDGEVSLKLGPCGGEPTHTIMEAEMVAIFVVLYHHGTSDSHRIVA